MRTLVVLLLCVLFAAPAVARQDIETRRIEYLISSVADLHGATFIRNGDEYSAAQAAAHLRLKLDRAGARIKTAEQFIAFCATGSSISGQKYRIRLADGRTLDTAEFLRGKLALYQAAERPAPG
jgi:hypothetical protein